MMKLPLRYRSYATILALGSAIFAGRPGKAEEPADPPAAAASDVASEPKAAEEPAAPAAPPESPFGEPKGALRLAPESNAWLIKEERRVVMDGKVCLREGQLEMFICPKGTKEHESILTVDVKAFVIHAGLLAAGAKVGHPVVFQPQYVPAAGTEIEITLEWKDEAGAKRQARGQDWIRDAKTKKPMVHPWVFAGSGYYVDPMSGEKHYQAEGGDFICVSNFPSAMLDLPVESGAGNLELLFEAATEQIPPLGTPVRILLTPKFAADGPDKK